MVLLKKRVTDQEVTPVEQRQSRARAERGSRSCLDWLSRTKNWPLPCRDSPEREQREIPGLVWEWLAGTGPHWNAYYIHFEVDFIQRKIQTKENIDVKGEWRLSQVSKIICYQFYSSSWSCSINTNRTGNLFLLLLWYVSAQQAPLPVPGNHSQTRPGISLCSLPILSLPGRGLFLVSWHNVDTGLLHLILVL